ncbi:MAG: hypothetical protein O2983_03785 [Planctomycetota bacterium]|nr:hypothetical protein [Planctomycetota bacterium]MDA1158709.1 hypothetical protein [Planctomycetota bacterium]
MSVSRSNQHGNFSSQLLVVLKTYLTRWDFYCVLILCGAFSAAPLNSSRRHASPESPRPVITPYDIPMNLQTHISVDGQPLTFENPADVPIPAGTSSVFLWGPGITDEVLMNVAKTPSVTDLVISNTAITDKGLSELRKLPGLRMLHILGTVATGSGLDGLAESGKLTNLSFSAAHLDAVGVRTIAKIESLKSLELHAALIEEKELLPLREMTGLWSINLEYSSVTDWSVSWLSNLKSLRQINIGNTLVTKDGVRRLRKRIPDIYVAGVSSIEDRSRLAEPELPTTSQFERHRVEYLWSLLPSSLVMAMWLGLHLKLQFAAPRSRMVPGFARAHLVLPACLVFLAAVPSALHASVAGGIAVLSVVAILVATYAWTLWAAHRNSAIMMFGLMGSAGLILLAKPSTQTLLLDWFVPATFTLPSMLLLTVGVAGLCAYVLRLVNFHEAMSEYGMVFSLDMAWDLASRSANRRRQQMEANAISKSVVNAWLLDHQFDLAIRYLPKSWLPRAVVLLQLSHGMFFLWSAPMMGLMIGSTVLFSGGFPLQKTVVPIFVTVMIPMMSMAMLNGVWLQHWRWFSSELLRPLTRRRYVSSILSTMALDASVVIIVPVILVTVIAIQGWAVAEFSAQQTWLICVVHIFANIVTSVAFVAWLISYRKAWLAVVASTASLIVHGGLTALSLELGPGWIPVVLPAVFVGAVVVAAITVRGATRRWNSIEFA